jgi:GT2 family glycosyltransferase
MIQEQFPEVDLVALKTNQGAPGGRNRGVEAAKAEICIFLDDDGQFIDPQITHRIVSYFQEDDNLASVAFLVRNAFTGKEEPQAIPRVDKRVIKEDYLCAFFTAEGAVAIRKQVFVECGMYWEKLKPYGGEGLELSYRLMDKGYRIIRTSSIEMSHRRVSTARPKGQFVYFNARNRCWIAAKNLPWFYAISTSLIWWGYLVLISLKRRQVSFFLQGVRDAIRELPAVLHERHPINKATVKKLKALSGRLWY